MQTTLAFDVYGTLIDTNGVTVILEKFIGDEAFAFAQTWRSKQLEYSFRRSLMMNYKPFVVCTKQALDYTCIHHNVPLTDNQKTELMASYLTLPAFDDVEDALSQLNLEEFRLFAFSNGKADALETLLTNAGIRDQFMGVVSVDDIKAFKPSPGTYAHFLRQAKATGSDAWLISSNPFDVIGAISAGMKAAWIQRSPDNIFDPWGIEPTITANSLAELVGKIEEHSSEIPRICPEATF